MLLYAIFFWALVRYSVADRIRSDSSYEKMNSRESDKGGGGKLYSLPCNLHIADLNASISDKPAEVFLFLIIHAETESYIMVNI